MFWKIFLQGLEDSFQPIPLTTLLLFFIFLSSTGCSRLRVFFAGVCFILTILCGNLLLILGGFDLFLNDPVLMQAIRIAYLILALTFIILGVLYFWDWIQYKRRQGAYSGIIQRAVFLKEWNRTRKGKLNLLMDILWATIGAIALGFLVTILSSASPQDYGTFINFLEVLSTQGKKTAFLSLGMYSFAFIAPILFVWVSILGVMSSSKINAILNTTVAMSFTRIVSSAIFLSMGMGLGYMFLKS